jgi:chaperonin cofactor prefoldin
LEKLDKTSKKLDEKLDKLDKRLDAKFAAAEPEPPSGGVWSEYLTKILR